MAKWVIRRTIDGKPASQAVYCAEIRPVLRDTGVRCVDDCIRELLTRDERVAGCWHRREVLRDGELVGFIDVTDSRP
jgi:hypothetical protein